MHVVIAFLPRPCMQQLYHRHDNRLENNAGVILRQCHGMRLMVLCQLHRQLDLNHNTLMYS